MYLSGSFLYKGITWSHSILFFSLHTAVIRVYWQDPKYKYSNSSFIRVFFTAYPFLTNFTDPIICPKTSLILKEAIYYCLIPIPFWGMIIIWFAAQTSRSVESKTQTIMKRKISITLWVVYEEWQVFPVSVIQYRACNCTSRRFLYQINILRNFI